MQTVSQNYKARDRPILPCNLLLKVSDSDFSSLPISCLQCRYNIMTACWKLEPTQRPTFSQICTLIQKQLDAIKEQVNSLLYKNSKTTSWFSPLRLFFHIFDFIIKVVINALCCSSFSPLNFVLHIYTQTQSFICLGENEKRR